MKNYDVSKIYEWPFGMQFIVIGIVSIIVFYLLYLMDISSLQNQITAGAEMENDLKQQLIASFQRQFSAISGVAKLPDLTSTLFQWQSKLITEGQLPDLQDQILKYGQENNLKFDSFNPGHQTQDGPYKKVPIMISMAGTYDQIGTFLSEVANMSNLVKIGDFTISRPAPKVPDQTQNNNQDDNQTSQTLNDSNADQSSAALNSDEVLKADLILQIFSK